MSQWEIYTIIVLNMWGFGAEDVPRTQYLNNKSAEKRVEVRLYNFVKTSSGLSVNNYFGG